MSRLRPRSLRSGTTSLSIPTVWTPSRNGRAASRFPRGPAKPKARQPTDQALTLIFHTNLDWRRPLKLDHASGSPNSRRVRILIAEKGLDIELAPVDLRAREEFADAYRAINPRAVVPTLVLDDGTAIGEVPAIMRYLDEAYPKVPLLGATPKEKALITMWERRAELEGFASVMEGVRNAAAALKDRAISVPHRYEQIPALIERSKQRVASCYTELDARVK